MAATYKLEVVTVLRPADPKEAAFVPDGGEQVLIRMRDGSECVVAKKDIGDDTMTPAISPNPFPWHLPKKKTIAAKKKKKK